MSKEQVHTFHVTELFLLASAFEADILFGLPDKKTFQLMGEDLFSKANEALIEKEILTTSGKITQGGAYVIRALEFYYLSKKYVRIHNMMFAFREKDEDEVILLVELEDGTYYRLYIMSKALVLKLLSDRFPFILREPKKDETEFLKKELPYPVKKELENYEPKDFLNMEFFHLEKSPQQMENPEFYQQWLVFVRDDQLFMVDPVVNKYYYVSQYWFLKVLFDQFDFPYKEVTSNV